MTFFCCAAAGKHNTGNLMDKADMPWALKDRTINFIYYVASCREALISLPGIEDISY